VRVLLADDHALLVEGLQNLLEAHGLEVVGVARNGRDAALRAKELSPDVILMDIRMPEVDGLAATRAIKAEMPDMKIIILTTSTEDHDLFEAIKAGAGGYLLKSMDAESLIEGLRDAEEGIPPFAPGLAMRLLAEFARTGETARPVPPSPAPAGSAEADEALTPRQLEVLTLVARGLSYKQVGAKLSLSPRTVKYHMAEITRKLHVQNRAQLLVHAAGMATRGAMDAPR
jgi:DNA-binding NarL/FixJ family response regulator